MKATKPPAAARKASSDGKVKVRILCDCFLGPANSVVSVAQSDFDAASGMGLVDDSAEAIAYAEELNAPLDAAEAIEE